MMEARVDEMFAGLWKDPRFQNLTAMAEDYSGSRDLEDLIAVVDGRESIVTDLMEAPPELRAYLAAFFRGLAENLTFQDSLPGYLSPATASPARLASLRRKLQAISAISAGGS